MSRPWATVLSDDDFLVQLRAESARWVDVRVFRVVGYKSAPSGYVPSTYGTDDTDATADLSVAPQFARGSSKNDGGWSLRIEFCDHTERNEVVEVNASALARVLAAIHDQTPSIAAGAQP